MKTKTILAGVAFVLAGALGGMIVGGANGPAAPIAVTDTVVDYRASQVLEGYTGFWRGAPGALEDGIMVLFDPMCPHCGALWDELKDEKISQFWVPVAVLNHNRSSQLGAMLIETEAREGDVGAQMNRFKMARESDPAVDAPPSRGTLSLIDKNTQQFMDAKRTSVPVIIMKSKTGGYGILNGSMSAEDFKKAFEEFHRGNR